MSGSGGYKHRKHRLERKRSRKAKLGKANVARVRHLFEEKGQTFAPETNSVQAQALSHRGRQALGVKASRAGTRGAK